MKRRKPCSHSQETQKKILKIEALDPLLGSKVFGGCLPAMNRILDYVPEIFWPNLRGTTKPMKYLAEKRLSKLRILSYPAEYPGKRGLQELVEAEKTWKIRDSLVRFFSKYSPNLTDMPGGLFYFLPAHNDYSGHLITNLKSVDSSVGRNRALTLFMSGLPRYWNFDPLFKMPFQEEYPFSLVYIDLSPLEIDDSCLFNHENLLRLPNLETFQFPTTTYSGFEEDFKYITECPKIKSIVLPFLYDYPEHCKSLALEPCESLENLYIYGCPDSLPEKYWDPLLSESVNLSYVEKRRSPFHQYVSPNFYRALPLVQDLAFLQLNLYEGVDQSSEQVLEEVKTEHKAALHLLSDQSMRFLTTLYLECLVSWHDRFVMIINENLDELKYLRLWFHEGPDDSQIMVDLTLHFYLDIQITDLTIEYELDRCLSIELVKIEFRSGPQLRENLETLAIEIEAGYNEEGIDEQHIPVDIFVQEFLKDCSNLCKLEFKDAGSGAEVREKIRDLNLPKLCDLRTSNA